MERQTSVETHGIILNLPGKRKSLREIVERHHCTIKKIIDKYAKCNTLENLPGERRPNCFTETEIRAVSAVKIAENIAKTSGNPVSASNVKRSLYQNRLHGRVPLQKPSILKVNRIKCLNFTTKYINQPQTFWNNIIFTDESKFEIFGTKKPPKTWWNKNESFSYKHFTNTVKHGGRSVMVWGYIRGIRGW